MLPMPGLGLPAQQEAAAMLLEAAGLKIPDDMTGRSLMKLVENPEAVEQVPERLNVIIRGQCEGILDACVPRPGYTPHDRRTLFP